MAIGTKAYASYNVCCSYSGNS